MEFMQQDLTSVTEIFEMIQTIELDQWLVDPNSLTDAPRLISQVSTTMQAA